MDGYRTSSAASLGRKIANGADPVEIAEAAVDALQAGAPAVFIQDLAKRARKEAEASRKRQKQGDLRGPLDGVPVAWKDLIDLRGTVTTCGSATQESRVPAAADAVVARNAAAAGMVSVGKTNLTEFAFSAIGLNPHFGTPANACNPDRAPGGSSSGSGVAVAAGVVPVAVGTDTGGSVRVPACFNGIVGYKSSEGRHSLKGVAPLAPSLDTVGPLCRTVEDCAMIDAALRGVTPPEPVPAPLPESVFFAPDNLHVNFVEEAVQDNFEQALEALRQSGAKVERGPAAFLDGYAGSFAVQCSFAALEACAAWRDVLSGPSAERMDPRVRARMTAGRRLLPDLEAVHERRRRDVAAFAAELGRRVLVTPTVAHAAPERLPLELSECLHRKRNLETLRLTMPGNWWRGCGLTLPSGVDASGLPTGILFTLPWGEDDRLLALGLGIERALRERAGHADVQGRNMPR